MGLLDILQGIASGVAGDPYGPAKLRMEKEERQRQAGLENLRTLILLKDYEEKEKERQRMDQPIPGWPTRPEGVSTQEIGPSHFLSEYQQPIEAPTRRTLEDIGLFLKGGMTPPKEMTGRFGITIPKETEEFTLGPGQTRFKGEKKIAEIPAKVEEPKIGYAMNKEGKTITYNVGQPLPEGYYPIEHMPKEKEEKPPHTRSIQRGDKIIQQDWIAGKGWIDREVAPRIVEKPEELKPAQFKNIQELLDIDYANMIGVDPKDVHKRMSIIQQRAYNQIIKLAEKYAKKMGPRAALDQALTDWHMNFGKAKETPSKKTLTEEKAREFLKQANGNKEKARKLARDEGYTF